MRYAALTIHTKAILHNIKTMHAHLAPHTRLLAMVKANAYGHGAKAIVPIMTAMPEVSGFGVASFTEAKEIRPLTDKPIVLIEGVFSQEEWLATFEGNFSCVIHHNEQLQWALHTTPNSSFELNRTIWLKYNTGMNRLGFDADSVILAAKALHNAGYKLILTSHFACADEPNHPLNQTQIDRFHHALTSIHQFAPDTQGSLCNSAGILNFKEAHHDWVRAGICLYGASPFADISAKTLNLKPAMTLSAKIIAMHELKTGDSVGYGGLWTADKPCRIGVVSMGYGDGYPRVIKNGVVSIQPKNTTQTTLITAPIIGRIAMDMFMIDLSQLPQVALGDMVILWGNAPTIDDVASRANTIGYELMCRLSHRSRPAYVVENLTAT